MTMFVIRTQYMENYGAHDWDGKGQCPQYWKMKGGHEYKILNVPLGANYLKLVSLVNVEKDDDYQREYIIDWSVESDDYLSWFEKSQLEFDGEVVYKEPEFEYNKLIEERTVA